MEKMLQKLARQLDSLDEASLMSLWGKYATIASRFEPTAKWEEAALIFSLIQAKRWKNQLFNYIWCQRRTPPPAPEPEPLEDNMEIERGEEEEFGAPERERPREKCRILPFSSDD